MNIEPAAMEASASAPPALAGSRPRAAGRGARQGILALGLILAVGAGVGLWRQPASSAAPADAQSAVAPPVGVHSAAAYASDAQSGALRSADVQPAAAAGDDAALRASPARPERPAPPFGLTDNTGARWRMEDQRGRAVLVFFGYTHCPDVCPQTLGRLKSALDELGASAGDVRVVLVTVDPARDTPSALADYLAGFGPSFTGLTGRLDELHGVADAFGVSFEAEAPAADRAARADHAVAAADHVDVGAGGDTHAGPSAPDTASGQPMYGHTDGNALGSAPSQPPSADAAPSSVLHSSRVFLVDAFGQLRGTYIGAFAPSDVAHDLRLVLAERQQVE